MRPPIEPREFAQNLSSKTFTDPSDRDFLTNMFERTFHHVLGSVEQLWFGGLGWGDAEVEELTQVLPMCSRLRELELYGNEITSYGASALGKIIGRCPTVQRLDLDDNKIDEDATNLLLDWIKAG